MNTTFLALTLSILCSFSAFSSVTETQFKKMMKGTYKIDSSKEMMKPLGDTIIFTIDKKLNVTDSLDDFEGKLLILKSDVYGLGLTMNPVATILLNFRSDEQTEGYYLSVTSTSEDIDPTTELKDINCFSGGNCKLGTLAMNYHYNDLPAQRNGIVSLKKTKLYKLNARTNQFEELASF